MLRSTKTIQDFDVRSIPGCFLWLDASADTTPIGSFVTTLPDRSGNGNDLVPTEANVMTRSYDGPNGKAVYNFSTTRAYHPKFSWQTNFTQFVVVKSATGIWFTTNGNSEYKNYVNSSNWNLMYVGQTFATDDTDASVYHISIFNATPQGASGWQLFCIGYTAGSQVATNYTLNGIERVSTTGSVFSGIQPSYPLHLNGRWDGSFDSSYVAEFIHFNASLTKDHRLQVEGYLAWKWGLNQIPSITEVPAILPTIATGCMLWLDGADRTTIFNGNSVATVGSSVTSWLDKSGNNNTATTSGSSTTLQSNGINFVSQSFMSLPGLKNTLVNTPFVVFAVETYAGGDNKAIFGDFSGNSTNQCLHINYRSSGNITMAFYSNDLEYFGVSGTGTMRLWTFYLPASTNKNIRLNGTLVATHDNFNRLTSFLTPRVGSSIGGCTYNGTISELIVFNVDLGLPAIQQMENYLLQKWKIATPVSVKPIQIVSPLHISGCKLWLDSSDSGTITFAAGGENVTTWLDKSGYNNTATTQVAYSTAIKKTSVGLVFDGGGFMRIPGLAGTLVNTPFVIFIVETLSSKDNERWFFGDDGAPGAASSLLALGYRSPTNASFVLWYNEVEDYSVSGIGSTRVWCFYLPTASNRVIRRNGVVDATGDNYTRLSSFTTPVIGRYASYANTGYKGTISEILIYPSDPGLPAIQRIEAYLINKWTRTGFPGVPMNIAEMALWLDGADVNGDGSATLDGAVISTWVDKSGKNANATARTGTVTYSSLTNSVVFDGATSLALPNSTIAPGESTFTIFIVCRPTNFENYPYVFFAGAGGNRTSISLLFYPDGSVENGFYPDYMGVAPAGSAKINETYLFTSAFNGTSRTLYMNGSPLVTGSPSGTKNTGVANNILGDISPFFGTISEMIVFNRTLSDTERQSIDYYLTLKWQLSNKIGRGPVSSVPGCYLWLDGADPNGNGVAPTDGSEISVWADKSGNGLNATATTLTKPIYTANIFNGIAAPVFNSSPMVTPSSIVSPNNTLTTFVVIQPDTNNPYSNTDFLYATANYAIFNLLLSDDNTKSLYLNFNNYTAQNLIESVGGKPLIISIVSDSVSLEVFGNGVLVFSVAVGAQSYPLNTSTGFNVGTSGFNGPLCEIIMFNAFLKTSQRKSIESYLAMKWGIETLPYTPVLTSPLLMPGCKLWLDGKDIEGSGKVFNNGDSITEWVDKSGFQNSALSAGSSPTFSTKDNGLVFSSSLAAYLQTPITAVPSKETIFCVFTPSSEQLNNNYSMFASSDIYGLGFQLIGNGTSFSLKYDVNAIAGFAQTTYTILPGSRTLGCGTFSLSDYSAKIFLNGGVFEGGPANTYPYPTGSGKRRVGSAAGADFFNGIIHELIYFDYILTLAQRKSIERYLSRKWGLSQTLYKDIPGQIPGCKLWLDANDHSTLFSNSEGTTPLITPSFTPGGSVGLWKDKSGLNRHYQTTGYPPVFSLSDGGTVTFSNSQVLINTDTWSDNGIGLDLFVVTTPWLNSQYSDWRTLFHGSVHHRVILSANGPELGFYNGGFQQFGSLQMSNTKSLLFVRTDSSSICSGGLNGAASSTAQGSVVSDAQPFYSLGGYQGPPPTQAWGKINEILIYSNLSTDQKQTIEAYLSKKWNVTTTTRVLPSSHKYQTLKPFTRLLFPTDVPQCQLWLDAKDKGSVLNSGTPVTGNNQTFTVWNDKSGNSRNMTVTDGTFSFSNNAVVSGSGYLVNTTPVNLTTFTVFVVVKPVSNWDQTLLLAIPNAGGSGYGYSDSFSFYLDSASESRLYANGTAQETYATIRQPQTSGPKIFVYQTNASSISAWANGTEKRGQTITLPSSRTSTAQGFAIGVDWGAKNYRTLVSPLHEVIVYNSVLTTLQRQQIEGYLAEKWKISLAAPKTFTFTGALQSWLCPQGTSNVTFHAWGAAGGFAQNGGVVGGAGAYMTGTLAVTPGTLYYIVVGQGGYKANANAYYESPSTYGGGGRGYYAGGGGGYSGIFTNSTPSQGSALIVVGGGGGAGPDGGSCVGGCGSWTSTGQNGGTNSAATPGSGGTQNAGGNGGSGPGGTAANGGALTGGNGAHYGGGGGAGYWGGGGGGAYVSGGGGGNSYYNSSYATSVSGVDRLSSNGVQSLGAHENEFYNYLVGGSVNWMNGGHGLIVLVGDSFSHPHSRTPPLSLQPFFPTNITGCVVWNDASQLSSLKGTWQNLAGTSYIVTCGGILKVKGLHGLNTVTLSTVQSWQVVPLISLNAYTLFWVGRQTGGTNGRVLQTQGHNQLLGYWGGHKRQLHMSYWLSGPYGYPSDTQWDMFSHSRTSGGSWTFNWNGAFHGGNSSSSQNPLYGLGINYGGESGETSSCEVGEIILYDNVLTSTQIQQVEGYLAQKWGFQIPVSHPYRLIPPARPAETEALTYSNNLYVKFYNLVLDPSINGPGYQGWGSLIGTAGAYTPINFQDGDNRIGQSDLVGIIAKGFMYSDTATVVTFRTISDDGIVLYFNGINVLQNWTYHGDVVDTSASVVLPQGYTPIELRFFEWGGGFTCELYWSVGSTGSYTADGTGRMFHNSTSMV